MATPSSFQQLLQVDVAVLEALLKRNQCSHRQCRYYQRLRMALKSLRRWGDMEELVQEKDTSLITKESPQLNKKRKKRNDKDELWNEIISFKGSQEDDGKKKKQTTKDTPAQPQPSSIQQQDDLGAPPQRQETLDQVISRLDYAAEALWDEIARGFFLPFCTVAVAAVARIRKCLVVTMHQQSSSTSELKANSSDMLSSEPQQKRPRRDDRMRQSLSSLGIALPRQRRDDSSSDQLDPASTVSQPQVPSVPAHDAEEEHVGQGVLHVDGEYDTASSLDGGWEGTAPSDDQREALGSASAAAAAKSEKKDRDTPSGGVDMNMALLQDLQSVERQKKKRARGEEGGRTKKKTKKSKKRGGDDFFDELFG